MSLGTSTSHFDTATPITCLGALRDYVLFTSQQLLFIWPKDADQPQAPLELQFVPATMAAFENRIFLACSDSALICQVVDSSSRGIVVESVLFPPEDATLFPLIAHSCFSDDGSIVAVCSQSDVFLVSSSQSHFNPDTQDIDGDEECEIPTPQSSFSRLSCERWFGSSCAVMTCFGPSHLFVVSKNNHLASFGFINNGDTATQSTLPPPDSNCPNPGEPSFSFLRDGGIISAAHSVTAMCVDISNGHLLIGISNGTVNVLDYQSLGSIFIVDIRVALRQLLSTSDVDDNRDGSAFDSDAVELPIMDIQLTTQLTFTVATPLAAIAFSKSSLSAMSTDHNHCLLPMMGTAAALSPTGLLLVWSSFRSRCVKIQIGRQASTGCVSDADLIHACRPLPPKFLCEPARKQSAAALMPSKPVTFGRPIKSSGYSASVPWSVQQARKEKEKKKLKEQKNETSSTAAKKYNLNSGPSTAPLEQTNTVLAASKIHTAVVSALTFDASGELLFSGSGDTLLHALKLPVPKYGGEGSCARGHTSMIHSVDASLSLQHPLVVSGSFDGTVALWRPTKREAPYVFQAVGREVKTVRFAYMDKLLCYSAGNTIHVAQYSIDEGGGDLDRKRNDSRIKDVYGIETSAQQVAAFDWLNCFLSTVLVWAGSNKQVTVHDVAVGKDVRVIEDAHSRPIHSLVMMRNSRFADIGSALHLFATASTDKTVRLWDMRQPLPVRQFSSHQNSSVKVGISLSPCGKFVAVGSEDRTTYIYSLSEGQVLARLATPDTVTAIAYHPQEKSVIALGCGNGDTRFFGCL